VSNYNRWRKIRANAPDEPRNYDPGSAMSLVEEAAAATEETGTVSSTDMLELSLKFALLKSQEQKSLARLFVAISRADRIIRMA
jgi:hypothetical protein